MADSRVERLTGLPRMAINPVRHVIPLRTPGWSVPARILPLSGVGPLKCLLTDLWVTHRATC